MPALEYQLRALAEGIDVGGAKMIIREEHGDFLVGRIYNPDSAVNAVATVAPCTWLHHSASCPHGHCCAPCKMRTT
jgi:hypothetical protein